MGGDRVHAVLSQSPRKRAASNRARKGLIFGPKGIPLTPTHTRRRGRLYQYYVSSDALRKGASGGALRVPVGEIEAATL